MKGNYDDAIMMAMNNENDTSKYGDNVGPNPNIQSLVDAYKKAPTDTNGYNLSRALDKLHMPTTEGVSPDAWKED